MDPELNAMSAVLDALSPLEPEVVARVLRWAAERYKLETVASVRQDSPEGPAEGNSGVVEPLSFANVHELFDAANPSSEQHKALVVGYWFQVIQKKDDLDGFQLNKELKNLGHPSTNITRDLDSLINRTPRFVMQVRKEGNSKQARKKYKLTREGIKAVDRMLRGNGADAES